MKKLALCLALIAAGMSCANATQSTFRQGRLVFQGGLTTTGCDVDSSVGKPTGPYGGNIYVNMPNRLSRQYIKPIASTSLAAFEALPNQAKRSKSLSAGTGDFTLSIVCPVDEFVSSLNESLGLSLSNDAQSLASTLNTKGLLVFSPATGSDEGGVVKNGAVGLLAPSPQSSAQGVGIAFLRLNGPTGDINKVVDFSVTGDTRQRLIWRTGTDGVLGSIVRSEAQYDFAYVSLTTDGSGISLGSGELRHVVGFKFVYDTNL